MHQLFSIGVGNKLVIVIKFFTLILFLKWHFLYSMLVIIIVVGFFVNVTAKNERCSISHLFAIFAQKNSSASLVWI